MEYSIDDLLKSPFEKIKRISEEGYEYWSARDLSKLLGYTEYRKFQNPINKAIEELGGTMPENLPTVDSIKKLERQKQKELEDKNNE